MNIFQKASSSKRRLESLDNVENNHPLQHTDVSHPRIVLLVYYLLIMNIFQKAFKSSSSKRRLESLDNIDNNHPLPVKTLLKRQCLDLQDDVNWIEVEIGDITSRLCDIKGYVREIDYKLKEIIDRIRQLE
jgi:hypothetical protein